MNVLLVDDEAYLLDIWRDLFSMLNCTVTTALGGYEAIDQLKLNDYSIIVTDVRMPEGDGFVVLDYLREIDPSKSEVFVCSGYIDDEETVLSGYNIERVIRKPFSFSEELEACKLLVNR